MAKAIGTANIARIMVLDKEPITSSTTGRWVEMDRPKSPCSTCHSQMAYCTGTGRSKP